MATQVLQEMKEAEAEGLPPPFYSSDAKMADSVMDFLFAAQVCDQAAAGQGAWQQGGCILPACSVVI